MFGGLHREFQTSGHLVLFTVRVAEGLTVLSHLHAGEDLGHPGLRRPTEPHQGQEDPDGSLQEGGAYRVASDS